MNKLWLAIKYYLRKNSFYKKHLQTPINNCRYFTRNCVYYYKKYSIRKDKEVQGSTLFFIIDPDKNHPGLTDRLKVIVCCYYIAKVNGLDFKIIFDQPFQLAQYLKPNLCNWVADWNSLSYSVQNSKLISYNGVTIHKLNKQKKQYHIYNYIGYDIFETNHFPNAKELWRQLFQELFIPEKHLQQRILSCNMPPKTYFAIHLRFVNALENFEPGHFNVLSPEQQENLINRCIHAIQQIIQQSEGKPILVFSDSQRFLDTVKTILPNVVILDGKIGHISYTDQRQLDNVVSKTLVDFYMIAQAEKIFAIRAREMYNSVFSYYAALVYNTQFTIIKV